MKNYLFLGNGYKPQKETADSLSPYKLDNVSLPCVEVAIDMGYSVYMGINRTYAEKLECISAKVKFYNACTYRSLLDIKSNYTAYRNLMCVLKGREFDVIHCNTPIGGLIGRVCGKQTKVRKIIYTAHGFHFYKGAPLFNRTILKWAEMIMARWTDAIITMNQEDYEAAKKFKLKKGGKIYNIPGIGINTTDYQNIDIDKEELRFNLSLRNDDIVLISMGDLIKRKNYEISIKAIAEANNTRLQYLICGRGPKLEELKKLAQDLNVEKQIHFLGFRSDIKELLQIADIFLFTTFQEGMPRSMMEAMSSGLPCIASKIRGNVDLIEDGKGGFLMDVSDVQGFANAICILAGNKKLRDEFRNSNLNTIKNFDIKNVKKVINDIYKEVLGV